MTKINKLVMQGFKSFAKHTEMPFSDSFNLVLGPNGAGKSNVLDAMCFVLGRLSSKDLRTEKLSNLIYNGGKSKQAASKGMVSLFFDNSKRVFPVDEDTIKVSRIVKPSGQSAYKINDKASSRQEILDLLAMARVDPNGYNIVLQGDINRLVEMSAEERRLVIEEISGISVYIDKKNRALNEFAKVEERIREADILLAERKTHLKELKRDRDQAMKYRELGDKISQDRATYLHLQIASKSGKKAEFDGKIAEHNGEIASAREAIEKLKAAVSGKRAEVASITEEVEQKGEQEQLSLYRGIEQLRVGIATSENRVSMIDSELSRSSERAVQLKSDLSELDARTAELSSKSKELSKQKAALAAEKSRLQESVSKLRGSDFSDVAKVEGQISKLDKDSEALQSEIQQLVEKKQQLLREKDRVEFQISSLQDSMKKLEELEASHKEELAQLEAKRSEFKKCVLELNRLLTEDSSIAARIGDAKKRLFSANEQFTKLKMQHLASRERVFGSNAVRAILEQDSIKGIHGTVSQLGSVQQKYSAALEAAAGPRINSIVVDSDATAARCIDYLKKRKIGRATFLPLNKLKKTEAGNELNQPGVHGLAVGLVSFDSKYKDVFNYVFGSTLVVNDIDTARKLGIGKYRMVTLDGDLTELSGSMHGGFRQKSTLAFQEADLSKGLAASEKSVTELEDAISVLEERKQEGESAISELRGKKASFEGEIIKSEKSLHLDSSDVDVSRKNREKLNAELKSINESLSSVEPQISGLSRKIADVKSRKLQLREQISSLGNPAVVAELAALSQKIDELSQQVLSIDTEISNSKVQSEEIIAQEKVRIGQILRQLEKEQESFRKEKDALLKKAVSDRNALKDAEASSVKFRAKNKELFAKRTALFEAIQSEEEKVIRKEEQINTTEVKINNLTLKSSELAGELAGLQEEFSRYSGVRLLENASEEQLKADISRFERMVAEMGNVNLKALEVYDDVEKQYNELMVKKDTLSKEKDSVIKLMDEIESKKGELFMRTFNTLNGHFKSIFSQLSKKGDAYLMLESPESPFEAGVRIRVKLGTDKFLDIRSLSGGEKSLTALAFIFAIQEHDPAPFYILDEVDAALDKKNSQLLANFIKKYSDKAQYIVISHNDSVITEANTLYGVSMNEDGISQVVSLKM